jgi:hypothetical protein
MYCRGLRGRAADVPRSCHGCCSHESTRQDNAQENGLEQRTGLMQVGLVRSGLAGFCVIGAGHDEICKFKLLKPNSFLRKVAVS